MAMSTVPRPAFVALTAEDPGRAATFYDPVFGRQTMLRGRPGEFWSVRTGQDHDPGINGGIRRRMPDEPAGAVNTIPVPWVDAMLEQIGTLGGSIIVPPFVVPGICHIAYAADPHGRILAVVESAPGQG